MKKRTVLSLAVVAPGLAVLLACGGGGGDMTGPSGSGTSTVRLASADVLVGGSSVNGATIARGAGSSTLFTVVLRDPADRAMVGRMQMSYPAHSSMGMMGRQDSVDCHDDGMDGDAMAGDGIYSYMDASPDGHVGVHAMDCPTGSYSYVFQGTDASGHRTNSLTCTVMLR